MVHRSVREMPGGRDSIADVCEFIQTICISRLNNPLSRFCETSPHPSLSVRNSCISQSKLVYANPLYINVCGYYTVQNAGTTKRFPIVRKYSPWVLFAMPCLRLWFTMFIAEVVNTGYLCTWRRHGIFRPSNTPSLQSYSCDLRTCARLTVLHNPLREFTVLILLISYSSSWATS